jgi:hypothetical protein
MKLAPGKYHDVSMRDYVMDSLCEQPTLSSSLANILLDRSPAHARLEHPRLSPRKEEDFSRVANFGSAVASMVFGGPYIVPIDAIDYKGKDAKTARDQALASGLIPLLTEEHDRAKEVSYAVTRALVDLHTDALEYEHTIIFRQGKALCRSRPDAMSQGLSMLIDLKVTGTNARECNRQFFSQGYDMQAAFMERAADSLDPDGVGRREIIYLFAENEPPYCVVPIQVSEGTLTIARKKMNAAVNLWTRCLERNEWPGYQLTNTMTQRPSFEETAWLIREETDQSINVESPQ